MSDFGDPARDAFFNQEWLQWIGEAYGASGFGAAGTALMFMVAGAIGLFNWTESFKVPAVWLALTTPLLAAALPAPVVWRLLGVLTAAVAMLFIGLFIYWRRL
jgi:hypothetical protein